MRLAEFIKLEQTTVWPCGRRALHRNNGTSQACEGIMALASEPHNSVLPCAFLPPSKGTSRTKKVYTRGLGWPRIANYFSIEHEFSWVGPQIFGRVGLVDFSWWSIAGRV